MYKFADKDNTTVTNLETGTTGIRPGNWQWDKYQEWVATGGITEPFLTIQEVEAEYLATEERKIREKFEIASEAPVTVAGLIWNGGADSSVMIQGAVSLAENLGEQTVVITDVYNLPHEMSFGDALRIAAQIGRAWRDAFFIKQAALVALNSK